MKQFKFLSLLAFVAVFATFSCKNDGATDEANQPVLSTDAGPSSISAGAAGAAGATPAAKSAEPVPVGPLTTMNFAETSFDFGEVMEGEKVVHMYEFTNTGKEPLIISNAKGSCGCTVPDWPREPIPVGATAEIKVQFDSKGKGKVGGAAQSKRVTITANTDPVNTYLTIKGTVNKDENAVPANPKKPG